MNRVIKFLVLAAIVGLAGVLIWRNTRPGGQPVVRGQPLSAWMQYENKNSAEYRAAVAEMDEPCVLWLIQELQASPSSTESRVDAGATPAPRPPVASGARPDYRAAAAFTLGMLGPRAQAAIPALRVNAATPGSGQPDQEAQSMAIAALILLGADTLDAWADTLLTPSNIRWRPYALAASALQTNAAPIVPRLVRAFESTTEEAIKERITMALQLIHSRPSLCVPLFRAALTSENPETRIHALTGLSQFGSESKPVWDDLVVLLADKNRSVRETATNTLRQIDREAAKKAGVK